MISNGWVSWATRIDGVPDKVWRQNRAKKYMVVHSIEGYLGASPVPPRFLSVERDASGAYAANAQASCMFVLHKDGTLIQMYPLEASPWTSGSQMANEAGVPIETEGVAGELLNAAQVATFVRLVREIEPWFGFPLSRAAGTIKEHREVALPSSPTACPSGRYQSAYDALATLPDQPVSPHQEEDEVDQELRDAMIIREKIRHLASDPDLPTVQKAFAALKAAGVVT